MVNPIVETVVEAEHGPFWACVDILLDEDGNSKYSHLIVRYKGEAILALSDNDEITEYFMCNVKLHIEIMKAEVADE